MSEINGNKFLTLEHWMNEYKRAKAAGAPQDELEAIGRMCKLIAWNGTDATVPLPEGLKGEQWPEDES